MRIPAATLLLLAFPALAADRTLPAAYFRLLEAGAAKVEARLNAEPQRTEKRSNRRTAGGTSDTRFSRLRSSIRRSIRANPRYRDPRMRELTLSNWRLCSPTRMRRARYEPRLDSDWDTYMWLEAYRLLDTELGEARRARWKQRIEANIASTRRTPRTGWTSPGTNRLSSALRRITTRNGQGIFIWAGGFSAKRIGSSWVREFCGASQWRTNRRTATGASTTTPDRRTGYNHLTLTGVALYYEYSKDPAVLPALRRSTDFHKNFTFLDGTPADVINDRNRRWGVSAWGQFAFTHFHDGRGYAAFLAKLLSAAESDDRSVRTAGSGCALLPRRSIGTRTAGANSLRVSDVLSSCRHPQVRPVAGVPLRTHEHASRQQPVLSRPAGPPHRDSSEARHDHHGRELEAPAGAGDVLGEAPGPEHITCRSVRGCR